MKTRAAELKIGDVIMPPSREVSLWMRGRCRERGLPESALHLTITDVRDAQPDRKGAWLLITTDQSAEWIGEGTSFPFKFKARPETPWPTISRKEG